MRFVRSDGCMWFSSKAATYFEAASFPALLSFIMLLEPICVGNLISHQSVSNLANNASTLSKTGCREMMKQYADAMKRLGGSSEYITENIFIVQCFRAVRRMQSTIASARIGISRGGTVISALSAST